MTVKDVTRGMPFYLRRVGESRIYISHGDGWYGPTSNNSGPWHEPDAEVKLANTKLHSKSFLGFNNHEVFRLYWEMADKGNYGEGDMALARYELSNRGLDPSCRQS